MVYRLSDGKTEHWIFEKKPFGGAADMYLDADGNVIRSASLRGHLAVGVPGTVAGMWWRTKNSAQWSGLIC